MFHVKHFISEKIIAIIILAITLVKIVVEIIVVEIKYLGKQQQKNIRLKNIVLIQTIHNEQKDY